jgi:phosphoribosylamine--glycine ligase
VVVGPEAPLVHGVADVLRHAGVPVFGPGAAAARIEGSKAFAKEVMTAAGVPTPAAMSVARAPCVVKADGLAAGKGVFVCRSPEELDVALSAVGALGGPFVVEELLEGPEVSVFAVCDGVDAVALAPAQDFKRAYDGDVWARTRRFPASGRPSCSRSSRRCTGRCSRSWHVGAPNSSGFSTRG